MIDLDAIADELAAKNKPPCWVCSIPEREWVDKAIKEGRPMTVIVTVLQSDGCGHKDATVHRIKSHKYKHVR